MSICAREAQPLMSPGCRLILLVVTALFLVATTAAGQSDRPAAAPCLDSPRPWDNLINQTHPPALRQVAPQPPRGC